MSRRYFSHDPITASRVTLRDEEAHHLLHVLRAAVGTTVVLFDGSGAECDAEVTACGRSTVELATRERREVDRELRFPLTLGVPLPKGDRARWLVEKCTELGVTRLVPLRTQHSQASGDKPSDKLARYVVEASKQCGRNKLMRIEPLYDWDDWLRLPESSSRRWVADPAGPPIAANAFTAQLPTYVAIGPEGGLTSDEVAAAEAALWQPISLGPRILRVETAALALAAILGTSR